MNFRTPDNYGRPIYPAAVVAVVPGASEALAAWTAATDPTEAATLRAALDDLMGGPDNYVARTRAAATLALEAQADAVTAWQALRTALATREAALGYVVPGRTWRLPVAPPGGVAEGAAQVEHMIDAFVSGLDVDALEIIAN
ncbi:hypothetical protein GCM10023081_38170 [Arthrobacter ginkgonis]|uniref:Uncharacterized protein n=1 Tax=Arthrobacter ginkgonis TaxID=1630594 RepID=A0ABP7D0U0_9MICC